MEVLIDAGIMEESKLRSLIAEANEILKVTSSARKTITDKAKIK